MHGLPATTARSRFLNAIEGTPTRTLVAAMLALHVVLSVWQAWFVQINDDGILYIQAARQFLAGDFAGARVTYGWFAFPLLIAAASKVTLLPPEVAGKAVNLLASTGTLALLLRLSWILRPSKLTLCALAALVFGNYAWNDMRGALTRDHLFIFFVVLGFFCLLRDRQNPKLAFKAGFAAACLSASLFRKEAAALLVMVPALLIVFGDTARWLRILAALVFVLTAAAIVFAVAYQDANGIMANLILQPSRRMTVIADQVLSPYTPRRFILAYSSVIAGLIVTALISSLGPLSMALTGWNALTDPSFRRSDFVRLFACYLASALVALSAQTYFTLVFEARYGLFLGLLLAVAAAVAATRLLATHTFTDRRMKLAAVLAALWLCYGLIGGLKWSDAGRFNYEAGAWLRANVPPGAVSLSNSNQINYYGDLRLPNQDPGFLLASTSKSIALAPLRDFANYDVVVLRLRNNQLDQVPALDTAIGRKPSVQFENSRGDKILIYQPRKPAS